MTCISERFLPTAPDHEAHARIAGLRKKFASLAADLDGCLPTGATKDQAIHRLEEAAMWSIKAITHG